MSLSILSASASACISFNFQARSYTGRLTFGFGYVATLIYLGDDGLTVSLLLVFYKFEAQAYSFILYFKRLSFAKYISKHWLVKPFIHRMP